MIYTSKALKIQTYVTFIQNHIKAGNTKTACNLFEKLADFCGLSNVEMMRRIFGEATAGRDGYLYTITANGMTQDGKFAIAASSSLIYNSARANRKG